MLNEHARIDALYKETSVWERRFAELPLETIECLRVGTRYMEVNHQPHLGSETIDDTRSDPLDKPRAKELHFVEERRQR